MAERFNLTAQIQLQAPTNVNQVVGNIRKQLSGITANVQVKGDARGLAQINKQMQGVSKSAGSASKNVSNLSRNLSEAARRFSVITVATGTMLALARAMKDGVGEAIAFERELIKISQVTGKTTSQLKGLTQEVTKLATGLGASSKDLLNVSRVLAQAGFSAQKTKQALDILAKTSLAATFDSIQDTTEGAIAVLRQFRKEARQAGGDIKFLEQTMDAINSVSKSFAVESGDLITVIRRVGGVFEAAGGSVNELIALFTSVRATTRESAETIATGLRTIFTRIQRTDTVDQLKALGIELRNSQGEFVGAFEAVRRLSAGLSSLDPKDYRFSEIVESLGGFRQIGKVIPLIRQFQTAQDALNVAQSASGSVARDAATAQQGLAVQAGKVAEEFKALMRQFADSSTFKSVAKGALEIARAMIRVADALEPVLPMLGLLAGLKIGRAVGPMLGGMLAGGRGGARRSAGGRISGFASGGHVPGTGNRDTVPAMLTPGEFVIKKSSAKKLGPAKLSAMNSNRYATGGTVGIVALKPYDPDAPNPMTLNSAVTRADVARKTYGQEGKGKQFAKDIQGKSLGAGQIGNALRQFTKRDRISVSATGSALGDAALGTNLERVITDNFVDSINIGAKQLETAFKGKVKAKGIGYSDAGRLGIESVIGNAFEGIISSIGAPFSSKSKNAANFDFLGGIGKTLAGLLGNPLLGTVPTDAKRTVSTRHLEEAVTKKYKNQLVDAARDAGIGKGMTGKKEISKGERDQIQQQAMRVFDEKGAVTTGDLRSTFKGIRGKDLKAAGFVATTRRGGTTQYAPKGRNTGGQVDSVPALLTPGEFVVKKSAAQSIGYSNLSKMNQTGVSKFAAGGLVGIQKFAEGSPNGVKPSKTFGISFKGLDTFEKKTARLAKTLEKMGISGDRSTRILGKFAQHLGVTGNEADALGYALKDDKIGFRDHRKATKDDTATIKKSTAATKQEIQQRRRNSSGGDRGGRGGITQGRGGGGFGGVMRELDPIANTAQSFVFAGAAAASLATQFSGLDAVTKSAITETSGFVASIVGLGGTLASIFTSMAVAGAKETGATESSAAAHATEVGAIKGGSKGMSTASKSLIAGAAAFTIVAAAGKYFAASFRATADQLSKDAALILADVRKGGADTGFAEKSIAAAQVRGRAADADTATWVGGGVAAGVGIGATVAGFAAFGAAAGSVVPVLGTLVGVVVGAIAGLGAYFLLQQGTNEEIKKQMQSIRDTANALIALEKSAFKADQAFADIEKANLKPEENIRRSLAANQAAMAGTSSGGAEQVLTDISKDVGKAVSSESDLEGNEAALERFKLATMAISREQERLKVNTKRAYETLDKASNLVMVTSGEFTFDELMTQNGQYAQSVRQLQAAIDAETQAAIRATDADIARNKITIENAKGDQAATDHAIASQDALSQQRADEVARGAKRQADLIAGEKMVMASHKKVREENIKAAKAAAEYRQSLDALKAFNAALNQIEQELDNWGQALDNTRAIIDGTAMDFSSPTTGLDNLAEIGDLSKFNSDIQRIADDLPAGANVSLKAVTETAKLFQKGRSNILDLYAPGKIAQGTSVDIDKIITDSGFDLSTLGPAAQEELRNQIGIAMKDNIIEPEEFDKIFSGVMELGEEQAKALKRGNDLLNTEVQRYQQFLQVQQSLRDKSLQADQKAIDVKLQTAEFLAKARGDELSIQAKEGARIASAQRGLAGTGLRAGDSAGARNMIIRNNEERKRIREDIAAGGLTQDRRKELAKRDQELATKTKRATAELDRLASQSERASDILGELDKERAKQDAAIGILEGFVTGGKDSRRATLKDAAGVNMAIRTGTIQNQSEEQRGRTFAMLDQLKDIDLVQDKRFGAMSGADVKKFITLSDSVRFGLISQEQAMKAMTQSTKEEKLIKALDNLANVMTGAADDSAAVAQAGVGGVPFTPIQVKHDGGLIHGSRGADNIPIYAQAGEVVVSRKDAKAGVFVGPKPTYAQGGTPIEKRFRTVSAPGGFGQTKFRDMNQEFSTLVKQQRHFSELSPEHIAFLQKMIDDPNRGSVVDRTGTTEENQRKYFSQLKSREAAGAAAAKSKQLDRDVGKITGGVRYGDAMLADPVSGEVGRNQGAQAMNIRNRRGVGPQPKTAGAQVIKNLGEGTSDTLGQLFPENVASAGFASTFGRDTEKINAGGAYGQKTNPVKQLEDARKKREAKKASNARLASTRQMKNQRDLLPSGPASAGGSQMLPGKMVGDRHIQGYGTVKGDLPEFDPKAFKEVRAEEARLDAGISTKGPALGPGDKKLEHQQTYYNMQQRLKTYDLPAENKKKRDAYRKKLQDQKAAALAKGEAEGAPLANFERMQRAGRMHESQMKTDELTSRTKELASTDFAGRDVDPFETPGQRKRRYAKEAEGPAPYNPATDPTLKQIEAGTHTFEGGKMKELGTKQEKRTRAANAKFGASDAGKQYSRDYMRRKHKKDPSLFEDPFKQGPIDSDLDAGFAGLDPAEQAKVMSQGRIASGTDSARADRLSGKRRRSGGGIMADIPMAGTTGPAGGGKSRNQILKQKAGGAGGMGGSRGGSAVRRRKYGGAAGGGDGQVAQALYNQGIARQAGAGYGGGGGGMNPALQAASYQPQQQPGMRRGGVVGGANMQAASAAGGGMSIDPTALQGVLSNFVQEFSASLQNITGPINTMSNSLAGIATSLSNLQMTHTFTGEIGMSVNIGNVEEIKAQMSEGVKSEIISLVKASALKGGTSNEQQANEDAGG